MSNYTRHPNDALLILSLQFVRPFQPNEGKKCIIPRTYMHISLNDGRETPLSKLSSSCQLFFYNSHSFVCLIIHSDVITHTRVRQVSDWFFFNLYSFSSFLRGAKCSCSFEKKKYCHRGHSIIGQPQRFFKELRKNGH